MSLQDKTHPTAETSKSLRDLLKIFPPQLPRNMISGMNNVKKPHLLCISKEQCEYVWVHNVVIIVIKTAQTCIKSLLRVDYLAGIISFNPQTQPSEVDVSPVVWEKWGVAKLCYWSKGWEVIRRGCKPRQDDSRAQVPHCSTMLPHGCSTLCLHNQSHPFIPFTRHVKQMVAFHFFFHSNASRKHF